MYMLIVIFSYITLGLSHIEGCELVRRYTKEGQYLLISV